MKNQWIRILIAGIGAQVLYYVFLYTILSSWGGAFSVLGLISMFVLHFVGGFWAVIKTKSKFKAALNGAFVGIVSIITFDVDLRHLDSLFLTSRESNVFLNLCK